MVSAANINLPKGFGKADNTAQILVGVAILAAVGGAVYLGYKLIKPVGDTIGGVGKGASTASQGLGQGISDIGTGTGQFIVKIETQAGETGSNIIKESGNTITGALKIPQAAESQATKAVNNIGDIYNSGISTIGQVGSRIKQAEFTIGHNILDYLKI